MSARFTGSYRSTWPKARRNGPRGVLRSVRREKDAEARWRDVATLPERRRAWREGDPAMRALLRGDA